MAFPGVDLTAIKAQLKQAWDAQGHLADVRLRDGTTFQIRITEGFRAPRGLTDGIDQEIHRIKVLFDDWEARSPNRPPERGDQFTFMGKRHAVQQNVRARGLNNTGVLYTLEVQG